MRSAEAADSYSRVVTLVVGGLEDGQLTMVADSKVTYTLNGAVEDRSRNLYLSALPKMVILRSDVAVGVTGEDPHGVIERLVAVRLRSVDDILRCVLAEAAAPCLVAALSPARLWKVGRGHIDGPLTAGRLWAGDAEAFEVFQMRMGDIGLVGMPLSFRIMTSLQFLTSFGVVPSVGGITMRLESTHDGFFFVGDSMLVGPDRLEVESAALDRDLKATLRVPAGGDPAGYEFNVIPGNDPTRGAVGLHIPQTGTGLLFRHERPWERVAVPARTAAELIAGAAAMGTSLSALPSPFGSAP